LLPQITWNYAKYAYFLNINSGVVEIFLEFFKGDFAPVKFDKYAKNKHKHA